MRPSSKRSDMKPNQPGAISVCVVLAAVWMITGSPAHSQTKIYKEPVKGPALTHPVEAFTAKADDIATDLASRPAPDLAFGAFQRGYYLTAFELALPRAESGDPAAQTLIAELYWSGRGVARDTKKAVEWYRFAAEADNVQAQFAYANILLRGRLVEADKEQGEAFMRKAAEAGHSRAQFNLAQIITARRPTWSGFKEALPFYQAAAESGVVDAQYAMANIHAEAKGVNVNDDVKAREWLMKAAKGGYDTAQVEMGIWTANGRGGPKDEKQALMWFSRAAARGNSIAQNRLARMYAFGVGTETDIIKAGAWHVVARRAGFSDSDMDRRFAALPEIDKKRAIELANRLAKRIGS